MTRKIELQARAYVARNHKPSAEWQERYDKAYAEYAIARDWWHKLTEHCAGGMGCTCATHIRFAEYQSKVLAVNALSQEDGIARHALYAEFVRVSLAAKAARERWEKFPLQS